MSPTFTEKRFLDEFFDPYNIDHLKAYDFRRRAGSWPAGFLPDDVEETDHGMILITYKMAEAWIDQALANNVKGLPSNEIS